jgi:Ca2+-binding RTX toxin-like protein
MSSLFASDLVVDDYSADVSTAGTVSVGGSASGLIEINADQDWFRINLTAGRVYAFDLTGAASGGGTLPNPILYLLNDWGSLIAIDDDSGAGSDARVVYSPGSSGNFYLSAQGGYAATGSYTLTATDIGADDYASSVGTTGTLAVGGAASGEIEFNSDQDWFRVELTAGHIYAFDMKGVDSGGGSLAAPLLYFLNGSGGWLAYNYGGGADARITVNADSTGTYYLAAASYYGEPGTYTLTATELGTDDDAGDISTTGTVAVGGSTTGGIQFAYEQDWFRIELTAGRIYNFDLMGLDSGGGTLADPHLLLHDATGGFLTYDGDSGTGRDARIGYLAATSGSYYLAVQGLETNGVSTGSYTLSASDIGADDYAGNTSTSGSLSLGGTATGNIQTANDQDWFRVELNADRIYAFDLKGVDSGGGTLADPFLRLLDGAGNALTYDDDNGSGHDARLTFVASSGGTYYLSAQGVGGAGTYTLAATALGIDDHVGGTATTSSIVPGASVSGNIQYNDDQDWFRVDLTAGTTYLFRLQGADSGNGTLPNPMLQLHDATGNYVASDYDNGTGLDALIAYTPASGGTYYLAAASQYGGEGGTYTLSVGLDDYLGSTLTSGNLALGTSISGEVQFADDQDWFRVNLVAGVDYVFDLKGAAAGGGTLVNPYLLLLDSAGNYIAGDVAHLFYTPGSGGTYYLAARGMGDTGTYSLSAKTDDFSGGIGTSGTLATGGSVSGSIDGASDQDWFRITLSAGSSYTFSLEGRDSGGGSLVDPLLRLRDSAGNIIASNQDGGFGQDAHLTHIAPSGGTYYLSVEPESASSDNIGSYTLSSRGLGSGYQATPVSNAIPITGTATLDGLIQGSAWQFSGSRVLTYSFNAVTEEGVNLGGPWTEAQKDAVREALLGWEAVANISFVEVPGSTTIENNTANIAFGHVGNFLYPAAGLGIFPSPDFADLFLAEVEYSRAEYPRLEGDVLVDDYAAELQYLHPGDSGFWVSMHELGHALGLKHPFDDGANYRPTFISLGIGYQDSNTWTAMSYNNTSATGYINGYPSTPMPLDIQAIQRIYGANASYHGGDNTYYLVDDGALRTIWDTGGNDWLDASALYQNVQINLAAGSSNQIGNQGTVSAIAYGVSIENARGGAGADTLTGTSAANILDGGPGADSLIGGLGNDTYRIDDSGDHITELANAGNDTVQSTFSHTLGAELENLVLIGANALNGTGNGLDNQITGNDYNNLLDGGTGRDTMAGGLGNDTYRVDNSGDHITELTNAGNDTVQSTVSHSLDANVENLALIGPNALNGTGNDLDNQITGNEYNNTLNGGAGRDTLTGGLGNDTYLVDNSGDQIIEISAQGIDNVNAALSWSLGANLENLTLTGAYRYSGTGNALDNTLTGNAAGNILSGGSGADTLIGGAGNDTYIVDNADDTIQEAGTDASDGVRAWMDWTLGDNLETLTLLGTRSLDGTGNTLNNTLTGNGSANVLSGGGGNDILDGASGNDSLTGGPGADTFAFTTPLNALRNVDTITDFVSGVDKLQLSSMIFREMGFSGSPSSDAFFHAGSAAHDVNDRILYHTDTGALSYDADGTGPLAAVQFALLESAPMLLFTDFLIG